MPQPKRTGSAPNGEITPEEIARIRASVSGKEQAPSSQVRAFVDWRKVADQLGQPFEVERIPISKLRAMRRDPMLGFGLAFIKTPFVRSKWIINAKDDKGPNAEVAANVDEWLRRIFGAYVFQWANSLDFGFQALVKRFELRTPQGTFITTNPDTGEQTEQPLWSQGSVQPIVWKTFVAMPPEYVEPLWNGQGEFDGIDYNPVGSKGGIVDPAKKIDIYHSLWITNERESVFGSIFGYPRLGYSFRYWWSYWFRWAIADRAFEKRADPSIVVRHPNGQFEDDATGEVLDFADYALNMGERMRSGSTVALPSDVYESDIDGRPSTVRMWDIEPLKDLVNFDPFDKSFDYLDIQKLRSLWIPEQAFLEGKGGTSSRNVAAELGDSFVESQALLAEQIVETVNRWLIPQLVAVNYPEFKGTAQMVMQGFAERDLDTMRAVINLIGQQEQGSRELASVVDLRRSLESLGVPLVSFQEQQGREKRIIAEAQAAAPPVTAPVPGQQVGVIPNANSTTGFSYVQPREVIYLSDAGKFTDSLPATPHYSDPTIRRHARDLRQLWLDHLSGSYNSFADFLESDDEVIELALSDFVDKAKLLIAKWRNKIPDLSVLSDKTSKIFQTVMDKASQIELRKSKLKAEMSEDDFRQWVENHAPDLISSVVRTTQDDLTNFVAKQLEEGVKDPKELAGAIRDHFSEFPQWRADRIARTEIRDAYNAATLIGARAAGAETVQALDAQYGHTDDDCEVRDGQFFTIDDALQEHEHPNGTLAWRIIKASITVERVEDFIGARYDPEEGKIFLSTELDKGLERVWLLGVGAKLNA